LNLWPHPC